MLRRLALAASLVLAMLVALTCGGAEDGAEAPADSPYPPTAQVAVHEQFLQDLELARHSSDGAGAVRLVLGEGDDGSVRAGGRRRWEFEFTAGPEGIAEGGSLFLLVPPFWGWSSPQAERPEAPGYTTATTASPGVELGVRTADRNLLQVEIGGRELAAGETVRLVYGAGPALARADDYAEARSTFHIKVDGDGDGVSSVLPEGPAVVIHPGPPERLSAVVTSSLRPGQAATLTVAVLDFMASAVRDVQGELIVECDTPGLVLPVDSKLLPEHGGSLRIGVQAPQPGLYRLRVRLVGPDLELSTVSNPLRVAPDLEPLYWGDLHGHSYHSDGTGTPRDFYRYARDVAGLDLAVLTDHDHFGVRFMDATPDIWEEIRGQVDSFNEPGRFVALLGYEWTSWLYGHRHVVYFGEEGEVFSSVGGSTTTPRELWDALAGRDALTIAHHSAGGPVAVDWSFVPDPLIEPVVEVMSVHGSSEALDSPARIYGPVRGNFVRDQLEEGMRFGFIGSGDSHDGHPGLAHLSPNAGYRKTRPDPRGRRAEERMGHGGLAGLRAADLTAPALLEALRSRRVYATSGPRIWLDARLDGRPMGSSLKASALPAAPVLDVEVAGTSGIEYVELVRKGRQTVRFPFEGVLDARFAEPLEGLAPGDFLYLRLVQNDGALAWSSPFFIE